MSRLSGKVVATLFIVLFLAVLLRNAWLGDDAYITFRTVDNFINGYGLTWNTAERVQAYTHPLWLFLLSGLYFFSHEIYYTSLSLAIILSLITILILAFGIAKSLPAAIVGVAILTVSKAFVDYSTSGLENPLTHLLLALFLLLYLRSDINLKTVFLLSTVAGLATLNRMDTLLLYAPALIYILFKFGRFRGVFVAMAGFLPFILWELFSLFYYGFPFPNTAYAKLNIGVDQWALLERGLHYLANSIRIDPLTLLIVAAGMLAPVISREWRKVPISLGIALYLLYIVRIGGDFMTGRFLTAPLLAGVCLLIDSQWTTRKLVWIPLFATAVIAGFSAPFSPLWSNRIYGLDQECEIDAGGIEDERACRYQATGLFSSSRKTTMPEHRWAFEGQEMRLRGIPVVVAKAIGFFGFYAGRDVYVIDKFALADPLLARLPPKTNPNWVIGHFERRLPNGYLETLESGHNRISDEGVAPYFDKLTKITRGNLLDFNRLVEIWNFNLGRYDHLIESYPPMFQPDLTGPETLAWQPTDKLEQYAGIAINLPQLSHAGQMELSLVPYNNQNLTEYDRRFYVIYRCDKVQIALDELEVPPEISSSFVSKLPIPAAAASSGYNNIQIVSRRSDNLTPAIYAIGQVKLLE